MNELRYVVCDVFTDQALTGNQLAVFTDASSIDPETMQALAREMAFSETVFVLRPSAGGHARLRIFTPRRELPFAGHPVLGSAFVIGTSVQLDVLALETGAGIVPVTLTREASRVVFGWMDQPLPQAVAPLDEEAVLAALGAPRPVLPVQAYDNGIRHAVVALESPTDLANLCPDQRALRAVEVDATSVVTGEGTAYESRVFCPRAGIAEDPATGSAAGPVAWHLVRHDRLEPGAELVITQGRALLRPSRLHARVTGTRAAPTRVEVGGAAVVVARGAFRL